ncbi:hypothetical protein EUBDOL_02288 [Amedibacillus dolichus DSM 3991]|uniref:Uncharacterized protein n=1 Tax=Amedibacillus dolichus DSM 3991 TaxID=428127 RepID=A8RFM6_9FIRM|nr:hypothetical protein EUBDOL_02288 [Amedibacillus dolichus DSM 3991]
MRFLSLVQILSRFFYLSSGFDKAVLKTMRYAYLWKEKRK